MTCDELGQYREVSVYVCGSRSSLDGDVALAVAAIAAEFDVDADCAPPSVAGILRAFSAAHYNAGVRDTIVRFAGRAQAGDTLMMPCGTHKATWEAAARAVIAAHDPAPPTRDSGWWWFFAGVAGVIIAYLLSWWLVPI
jgi:hypothetical protein